MGEKVENPTEIEIPPEKQKEIKKQKEEEKLENIRSALESLKNLIFEEKIIEKFAAELKNDLLKDNKVHMLLMPTLIKDYYLEEIKYDLKEIYPVIMNTKTFSKKEMAFKIIEIQQNLMKIIAFYEFICKNNTTYNSCEIIRKYNENSHFEFHFYLKLLTNYLIKTLLNI
ncbi:MAG: hypothetical protein QW046_02960 [Candidatus Micrarchaeaceae archaeon]